MKKFLTSLCLLLCTVATWGAKANGQPVTITQPDGTLLTVVLHGDEHASWYTTLDGTLLVQQSRAYYVAKVQANGTLASTGLLAHTVLQRNAQEQAAITAQDRTAFFSKMGTVRRTAISTDKNNRYFPHTGSPKALVLLVEFSDSTFTVGDPKKSFEQYLNGEGEQQNFGNRENRNYRSVKEYFKAMSNGAFTPQFDLYGPYKLQKTHV